MSKSAFFSLSPRTQQAVVTTLGWRSLRPVQEQSIPPLLRGDDAVILAPTAGGKTEAALLPLLDRLSSSSQASAPNIIYLCPLKALINNLLPRLQSLAQLVGREAFAWHGEVSQSKRKAFLKDPKAVLLTTPESLQVLLSRRGLDLTTLFSGLNTIVVDEVHAFCGEARGDQLIALLTQLDRWAPKPVQRVGLSATVGNPQDLLHWLSGERGCRQNLVDPNSDGSAKKRRLLEIHPVGDEPEARARCLGALMARSPKSLLFVDSRRQAEDMRSLLEAQGVEAHAHHSSLSQDQREQSESVFRQQGTQSRRPQLIVCTSTLELGLDVGDVDRVFQLDAPSTVSAFLQRFGRAGRREDSVAHMLFITDRSESFLRACALVKLALAGEVEPVQPRARAFPVLVQQMLMQVLREGALAPDRLWQQLGPAPCFAGISESEKAHLLEHLLAEGWLVSSSGRLHLGERTEKRFGRSHFLELLSVFQGGASASVQTSDGRPIGTLDLGVARQLAETGSAFLLGGQSWKATRWQEGGQVLTVTASAGGRTFRWSGSASEESFALSRCTRQLLSSGEPLPFLGPKAAERLSELQAESRDLDPDQVVASESGSDSTRSSRLELWAGHRVGRTVAAVLGGWLGCEATSNARQVKLKCSTSDWQRLLAEAPTEDQPLRDFLRAGLKLHEQRSPSDSVEDKFVELLPPHLAQELRFEQHYDLETTQMIFGELKMAKILERCGSNL